MIEDDMFRDHVLLLKRLSVAELERKKKVQEGRVQRAEEVGGLCPPGLMDRFKATLVAIEAEIASRRN